MYTGLASMMLAMFTVVNIVADQLSANQMVGAIAGIAGSTTLAVVFTQFVRTYNSSQRWKDAQLERQDAEIKSLKDENEKIQTNCDGYREQAFKNGMDSLRLHREIGALIQVVDHDTASKLRGILLGGDQSV